MTPQTRTLIEAAGKMILSLESVFGYADPEIRTSMNDLRAAISSAKAAEDSSFNEGIEAAALYACSRCRSEVPLVVMSNGCIYHKYDNSFYKDCHGIGIRSLKRLKDSEL